MLLYEELSSQVIGAIIEVHRHLGPGLLESCYEQCLCHELSLRGIPYKRQTDLPVSYKGIKLNAGYRLDLIVDEKIVLELKSVSEMNAVYEAQVLTYLKLSGYRVGLLVNFNTIRVIDGIKRLVN